MNWQEAIKMIYVYNPLRTALLVPAVCDMTPEPVVPLHKRISRIMIRIAKILLFAHVALIVLIGGTLLINAFCPSLYGLWLLFVFIAGIVSSEIMFG